MANRLKIPKLYPVRKFKDKWLLSANSIKMDSLGVFLHAEFISVLKTEQKPIFFEKYAKQKKISYYSLFSVIFSKCFKEKLVIKTESCFLDGKKSNIAKLVDINFLADNMKIARLYPGRKFSDKWLFSANFIKMHLFGYFCR